MKMTDILIKDGTIITMDRKKKVIKNGSIAVDDKKIVEIGEAYDLKRKYKPEITIEAKGRLVLPGFVNVHTHTPTPFLKGIIYTSNVGWKLIGGIRAVYKDLGDETTSDILYHNS